MKYIIMVLTAVAALASCGRPDTSDASSAAAAGNHNQSVVVIAGYNATPTNGGINPKARAAKITVNFTAGNNRCMASQYTYALVRTVVDGKIHLYVTKKSVNLAPRACTMEFLPVTASLSTVVFGEAGKNDTVIIENVKALGKNVTVKL